LVLEEDNYKLMIKNTNLENALKESKLIIYQLTRDYIEMDDESDNDPTITSILSNNRTQLTIDYIELEDELYIDQNILCEMSNEDYNEINKDIENNSHTESIELNEQLTSDGTLELKYKMVDESESNG